MSTPAAHLYHWHGGELLPVAVPEHDTDRHDTDTRDSVELLAADSWLTVDGKTRGLELHRQRFTSAVATQLGADAPSPHELDAFWRAFTATFPVEGRAFPRVELVVPTAGAAGAGASGAPQLRARMRPAPPTSASITLRTHTGDDPRTRPEIKGPDLEAMLHLRSTANAAGADEAVVLVDGQVVEGATTAVLWWNGNTLVTVPNWMPRVASVTELSIRALATAFGTEVVEYLARPDELDHKEIWAVNALHGIRLVTAWADGPTPAAEPGRHDRWRRSLDVLRSSAT